MNSLFKAALGVPDPTAIKQSGGRSLIDPIGSASPNMRQYTDPLQMIHPAGGVDYATGTTESQRKIDADYAEAKKRMGATFKTGGKVKASAASKRADGIAQRGKTKGRFV